MKKRVAHISLYLFLAATSLCLIAPPEALCRKSSRPAILLKNADACRRSLYRSAKKKKYRHNWLHCIGRYRTLYTRYPKSEQAPWALYHSATMYTKLYGYSGRDGDLDKAIGLYKRVVKEYSHHRLADDSQYKIGVIYYRHRKDHAQAYVEFLKVDIKFPSGDMRPRAKVMLDRLSTILGKKEIQKKKTGDVSRSKALTKVKDIRHWSTPGYPRVVIDLERPIKYRSHRLKKDPKIRKPERLYVDLQNSYVGADIESTIPIKDGLLQRARAGQYNRNTVRVVLDINSIGGYKTFHLYDPFRIVVDVRGMKRFDDQGSVTSKVESRPVRKGIRKVKKPDKTVSLAGQLGLTVRRIVIDPGHGGKDPGCHLPGGIKEKDIVLSLAKILARKIKARLQCEVFLTRTTDVFLSLEQRTAFANMKEADLFISLHINAYRHRGVYGIETYFLNMATDKRAVILAARENATSEKNMRDLKLILNDLLLNTNISESSRLAHEVQKGMLVRVKKRYTKVKSLGVKQAPFYVLIGADMPAILVETGFITNPLERKRLLNKRYRGHLADGMVRGIDSYIKSIGRAYGGG
jgi:N-acetylmuramoyl-L-alanine amidase